jgi:hypothetical protein
MYGHFKKGVKVIRPVKYTTDLVLLSKKETVLQGMIDNLTEIRRSYGIKMNVENPKVMRI